MTSTAPEIAGELLLAQCHGVLSTHSLDCPGYPFGSLVPYALDQSGKPVLLISRLAQHTKNIAADPRVSLLTSNVETVGFADIQTSARLTLLGSMQPVSDDETRQRYERFFPDARGYLEELDFDLFRLEPLKARFIGGFGQIHWVPVAELCTPNPFANEAERDIVGHMNADHAAAVARYCELAGVAIPEGTIPQMAGVDASGFHVRVGHKIIRRRFDKPVTNPNDVRKALIRVLKS